jgi:ABC-type transport system involved in multi-copper enzyme maturation permease subunit
MIREVTRKELFTQRALFGIAFVLVLLVTAAIPFFFDYSLKRAALSIGNETTVAVLRNFRSYPVYIESQWLARNFARILCLLALIAGAGAIAGERENRTLPLLYRSSVPLSAIALIKFTFIATWLAIVAAASTGVLAALSLGETHPFSILDISVAAVVAWGNAMAFLGVVFAASAFTNRTAIAAGLAVAAGFLVAFALAPLGLNGTALALNVFAVDGSVSWQLAGVDLLVAFAICGLGLLAAVIEIERRRAS